MITTDLESYYKYHASVYDLTRWSFLFGRNDLLNNMPELPQQAKILDVGCGTGYHLMKLSKMYTEAELTGVDVSNDMLSRFRKKISTESSIQLLNTKYSSELFPENHFHLIVCSYSLTMMKNPQTALEAIKKHLKKDGILAVIDFSDTAMRWFETWMYANHVEFGDPIFNSISDSFELITDIKNQAYSKLWTYRLMISRK